MYSFTGEAREKLTRTGRHRLFPILENAGPLIPHRSAALDTAEQVREVWDISETARFSSGRVS